MLRANGKQRGGGVHVGVKSFCVCLHVCVYMLGTPLSAWMGERGHERTSQIWGTARERKGWWRRDVWRIHNMHVILWFSVGWLEGDCWRLWKTYCHVGGVKTKRENALQPHLCSQHYPGFVKKPGFLWISLCSPFHLFSFSFLQDRLMPVTCWGIIL